MKVFFVFFFCMELITATRAEVGLVLPTGRVGRLKASKPLNALKWLFTSCWNVLNFLDIDFENSQEIAVGPDYPLDISLP